jgi:hypothetical protein
LALQWVALMDMMKVVGMAGKRADVKVEKKGDSLAAL